MRKKIIFWIFGILLLNASESFAKTPLSVVATIGQITDVVQTIAGEHARAQGLMGAGVDPHLYKASESDVQKLAKADILFYNGLFLEAKMEHIFEKMARVKKTVPVGEAVEIDKRLESVNYSGHYDPHIWFDVTLWMKVAQKIAWTLMQEDPAHKDIYEKNLNAYMEKLEALHQYVMKKADELPASQRLLITAHDAFRYFGRQYHFEVVGLQGISTESQAGVRDIMKLADFITQKKIRAIFIESSVSERNIKAVQEAVKARGWDVKIGGELFSDAMGTQGTFEGTYIGMVTHNIDVIVNALKE